jgi:hypothetical protein
MAVSANWFGNAFVKAFNKEIDFDSDTIKCALFTNAHAPDQDVDTYYDAANGMTEVSSSGTNYTTGGATISSPTMTYTGATNVLKFSGGNVSWTTSTITARYAIVYDSTPASNKPLLCYVDFGADVISSNGTFSITWDAAGIATVTVS